jgi:hypothetical protein
MSQKAIYCAECMEDIPNDQVQWEDSRLYCGRCGSELSPDTEDRDLLDDITSGKPKRLYTLEDDDDEEEEDDLDEDDDDEDGDWDEDEEEEEEGELEEKEEGANGRARKSRRN